MKNKNIYNITVKILITSIFLAIDILIALNYSNISIVDRVITTTVLLLYAIFYYLDRLIPALITLFFFPYIIITIRNELTTIALLVLITISAISFPSFKFKEGFLVYRKKRTWILDITYLSLILIALIMASATIIVFMFPKLLAPESLFTKVLELMNAGLLQRIIIVAAISLTTLPLMKYFSFLVLSIKTKTKLTVLKVETRQIIDLALFILFINVLYYPVSISLVGITSMFLANPLVSITVSILIGILVFRTLRKKAIYIPIAILSLILLVTYVSITNTSTSDPILSILGIKPLETPLDKELYNTTIVQAEYYRVMVLALQYMGLLP